ncbi:MAG: hypothetical protein GY856_39520 [bacterium]|nr:hypothetical protein [bacterium]
MAGDEALVTVLDLVDVFAEMKIPYHVGGSLASSVHGVPRQTHDLDLGTDLPMAAAAGGAGNSLPLAGLELGGPVHSCSNPCPESTSHRME